jgi:hypothetical protein
MRQKMALIWEMKRKRVAHYIKAPLMLLFGVGLSVLTSWIFHVLFALYTRDQSHMSIFEWIDHLFALLG